MGEKPRKISEEDFLNQFGGELDTSGIENKDEEAERARKAKDVRATHREAKPVEPPIDPNKVVFTDHALEQFVKRFRQASRSRGEFRNPEKTALNILGSARETDAIGKVFKIRRLIKHGFKEMRYFANSGWRFVLKEEGDKLVVITVERSY